ncbi:zinc-binding dehydrogenase [Colletotrichum sojae]|uniref:Zinc-binding dehydrogenase n=1 Tax=Colletotrichum sojae TaxID=2175907 RepID=A0A8H6IMW3_9PEZI|nr:zinc-binding dehydrogenase [Colletotrichum sojae]
MSSSNRAWRIPQPGNISHTLKLINTDRPAAESLGKSELLIEVAAVGINPHDYKVVEMGGVSRTMVSYPRSPGLDYSGRVLAVGRKVDDVAVGDRVFGRMDPARPGSLAEHIVVPYEGVTVLPEGLSLLHAGGAATAALAAYQSITPYVKPGDRVFLNGGSGGVGTFAIQIAKALGCHVTVSCSTAKVPLCEDLGADEVIDYRATSVMDRLRAAGKVFSLIADYVGGSPADLFAGCNDLLVSKPSRGHFIYVGGGMNAEAGFGMWAGTALPSFLGGSKFKWETQITKNSREDLARIAEWMPEGRVRVVVDSVFGFEDVPAAFGRLKEGHASGKIIVSVRPEEGKS